MQLNAYVFTFGLFTYIENSLFNVNIQFFNCMRIIYKQKLFLKSLTKKDLYVK